MKKILSFLELIIYIIIAIFGNSMIFFPVHAGKMEMTIINKDCIEYNKNNTTSDPCNHSCCYKSSNDVYLLSDVSNLQNNNISKIKIKHFDILIFSQPSFENKNLVKIVSPPYFYREIKYYWYKDLIKITKSNT